MSAHYRKASSVTLKEAIIVVIIEHFLAMNTDYFRLALKCNSGKGAKKRIKVPCDFDYAEKLGLKNGFTQDFGTASESFIPPFNCEGV